MFFVSLVPKPLTMSFMYMYIHTHIYKHTHTHTHPHPPAHTPTPSPPRPQLKIKCFMSWDICALWNRPFYDVLLSGGLALWDITKQTKFYLQNSKRYCWRSSLKKKRGKPGMLPSSQNLSLKGKSKAINAVLFWNEWGVLFWHMVGVTWRWCHLELL